MSSNTEEQTNLPPLKVIDAIDKWVHQQTRFHLSDTDGYREMLTGIADAIQPLLITGDLPKAIRDITGGTLAGLLIERDIYPTIGETNWATRALNQEILNLINHRESTLKAEYEEKVREARIKEFSYWFAEYISTKAGSGNEPKTWLNTRPISVVALINHWCELTQSNKPTDKNVGDLTQPPKEGTQ